MSAVTSPSRPVTRSLLHGLGLEPARLQPVEKTLLAVAGIVLATAFIVGYSDAGRNYGGVDLRNRVVGARVYAAGLDPYLFVWQPGMSEEWKDPTHFETVPRLTVPPTCLILYRSLSWLPYRIIRPLHFVLEWIALLTTAGFLTRLIPGQRTRVAFLVLFGVFFAGGSFWRIHTANGQLYAFQALLLAVGVRQALRSGLDSWSAGLAFGLAAAVRPNFAPVFIAFLVLGRFRTAVGMVATGAAAIALTLPNGALGVWKSYSAMGDRYYHSLSHPEEFEPVKQPEIWAENFWFESMAVDQISASASFGRFWCENRDNFGMPRIDVGTVSKVVILGTFGGLFVALWSRRRTIRPRAALLAMATVLTSTEFFLPHRWAYVEPHSLIPLALAATYLAVPRTIPQIALGFILTGLILGNTLVLTTHPYTSSLSRPYLLTSGLIIVSSWALFRTAGGRNESHPLGTNARPR